MCYNANEFIAMQCDPMQCAMYQDHPRLMKQGCQQQHAALRGPGSKGCNTLCLSAAKPFACLDNRSVATPALHLPASHTRTVLMHTQYTSEAGRYDATLFNFRCATFACAVKTSFLIVPH